MILSNTKLDKISIYIVNYLTENHLWILQRIYFCLRASTLIFKNQEKKIKSKLVSNNAASKSNKLKIKL